ncbi:MAG: NuoF family protein [Chloroflexota bacterium]
MTALVRVGVSSCGLAAGSGDTLARARDYANERPGRVIVQPTGCLGACHREPLVEIVSDGRTALYGPIRADEAFAVLDRHLGAGALVGDDDLLLSDRADRRDYPFLGRQVRVTTQLCGVIDPGSLDDYLAANGYEALRAGLKLEPDRLIDLVAAARLRGRGGAGFPTARKWRLTRDAPSSTRFVVCNADEGDPGAFMDRTMLEGDPHRLIEGMILAGWAMGASRGFVFIRAEYPLAVRTLRLAIDQAHHYGALGARVLGSEFSFDIEIREGAGAFVCGEETALIHAIEGGRGSPRMRPPYPSEVGLWGHPTCINNVETLASIPSIVLNGAEWFAGLGTARSGGTKAFALTGSVARSGLVEIPLGATLRGIVEDIGGGCLPGRTLKAVQLGGPSGGCVPASLLDTVVDYEDLKATGAIMGSGGMVVVDDSMCMVEFARFFLRFTQDESCGKCVPCRVGTRRMLGLLERVVANAATMEDLARLKSLCATVGTMSLCGLGQTAPNPVLTTLRHFEEDYLTHVRDRACRVSEGQGRG